MEFIEKLLQDAADRGDFDAGESAGRKLHLDDSGPGWWGRREAARIASEDRAHDAIIAVEQALGQVWRLASEHAVRERVAELNRALDEAGAADAQLAPDEVVTSWRRMARMRLSRSGR